MIMPDHMNIERVIREACAWDSDYQIDDAIETINVRLAALTEQHRLVSALADRADMQAWQLLAHEYGEHFHVADSDTSKWADKVRSFVAASSMLREALNPAVDAANALAKGDE